MNMRGLLSRCVDKPANAVGRFKGLAAGSCHFLHARCPHEQLAYNGLQIGSSVRNGFLVGPITSELRRTLCSSLNLEFRPDLAIFRQGYRADLALGLANANIATTNGTRRPSASATGLASDLGLQLYPKIEENDLCICLIRSGGLCGQHQEGENPATLGSAGISRHELVQETGLATLWVMGIGDILSLARLALLICNQRRAQIIEMNSWTRCHISPAKQRSTVRPLKAALLGKSSPKKYSCL